VSYSVGQVSALAGVTVRTLHHYDEIGLLTPSDRTRARYRQYTAEDLDRLRQIRYYRELGFPLDRVADLVNQPDADTSAHLRRQHRLLRERIQRFQSMVDAIEREMEAREMGISLTPEEQFEVFGPDYRDEEWVAEAEQRWGDSDTYQQSRWRTGAYSNDDWLAIKAEATANEARFAELLRAGAPVNSRAAMAAAAAHRDHITQWFYDCSPAMHRGLAELYLTDERFRKHYEDIQPGLAQYVHDAILADADRHPY
jgi:DNA-binding transcriptional MerR regulator